MSMILVTVSVDKYFILCHPIKTRLNEHYKASEHKEDQLWLAVWFHKNFYQDIFHGLTS